VHGVGFGLPGCPIEPPTACDLTVLKHFCMQYPCVDRCCSVPDDEDEALETDVNPNLEEFLGSIRSLLPSQNVIWPASDFSGAELLQVIVSIAITALI